MLELLAALADKSILITEYLDSGARYRLPETLREFGQERLQESGEYTALRRRHRDWHEQLAAQADTGWLSPQMTAWAARLFREHANVQAAQDFCQAEPGEAEAGLRIAMYVWTFYYRNAGNLSEGRYRVGQALARALEPTVWRARGLLLASFLAAPSGDHAAARALLAEGTSLARQLNDPFTSAFAAYCAGNVCTSAGDLHRAIAHFEDGLAALPAASVHDRQRAHLMVSLTIAAGLAGDEGRVLACQRELAVLTEAGGESVRCWHAAYCLWALGLAAWRQGDLQRAERLEQESLRLRDGLNDLRRSTVCLEALAWIAASGHQYERAAVLLGAAGALWRSMAVTLDGVEHLAYYQRDCCRHTRQALGEQAFQAAYARGSDLPAEEAFAYALQQAPKQPAARAVPAGTALTAPRPGAAPLTAREMQVARLLAGGCTNKEIAARLVIAQRTAEGHVERILAKLGFSSRAEIAAWVAASQASDDGP